MDRSCTAKIRRIWQFAASLRENRLLSCTSFSFRKDRVLIMAPKTVLVTGSSGLIGSEAVEHFDGQGYEVHGVDNNMRRIFFGDPGDTSWNLERLRIVTQNFSHHNIDIR